MARAIADGDRFSLGTPSLAEDGATACVPILRDRSHPRGYILAAEAGDEVNATDPGRIDRLRVSNASRRRLFVPPGTLFEGRETASRGTTQGVMIEPGTSLELEVRCVHPSQGIRPGAPLLLVESLAPEAVRQALLTEDQGLVWERVRHAVGTQGEARHASDSLIVALAAAPAGSVRGPAVRSGTAHDGQCGIVRLDAEGVEFVEVFDSPESWKAIPRPTPERRGGSPYHGAVSVFARTVVPENAIRATRDFLASLADVEYRRATAHSWVAVDSRSEYTVLGDEVVHLVAYGREAAGEPSGSGARGPSATEPLSDTGFPWSFSSTTSGIGGRASGEGDVAVAEPVISSAEDEERVPESHSLIRRRKILTSGWDPATFETLERFSKKEYGGDRSAAMRSLVRQGLQRRGYFGPRPRPVRPTGAGSQASEETPPAFELMPAAAEIRIRDFERIAQTEGYAPWLRERARVELERMASSSEDDPLREAAQLALGRLPSLIASPEIEERSIEAIAPAPPPLDVRPLLRRAFSASAMGQYSDALRLFDEVLDAEPENRTALLGRAVALRRSGKAPEALAALDLVLRLEPANAAALLNRGRILLERGDLSDALDTVNRLAEVAPNDWDVWMARGEVLARLGRDPEALAAYSEALRRNPDDENLRLKIRALERTRPPPPPSSASIAALPREVQEGQSYLVKENRPDLSYRVLRALAVRSLPALVITQRSSAEVRKEQGLREMSILEITHAAGEGRIPPTSLPSLANAVERFVNENRGRAAVLLDGLGPLVESNGFRDTALFIEHVNEAILPSRAIFLVSVMPGILAEKEIAILERDLRVLS